MVVFPLLADPAQYRACETDLLRDEEARAHWLKVYADLLPRQLRMAAAQGFPADLLAELERDVRADLDALRDRPTKHGRLDILLLDQLRQAAFRRRGITDECREIKQRENALALEALPGQLAQLDAMTGEYDRFVSIVRGMLAGNLFDMGVQATAAKYSEHSLNVEDALAMVPPRPWRVDDLDRAWAAWEDHPPGKAVLFADNAGPDLILGLLPLARFMLKRGSSVVIAANEKPSHNDITHAELRALQPVLAAMDPIFNDAKLTLLSSGNAAPLIDLREVSDDLAAASSDATLVVLVGMGRALETNYSATMTCACWKIAMVKDPAVARALGATVFDAVFRFDPPASRVAATHV